MPTRTYKPSLHSLAGSLAYGTSPALLAVVVGYFMRWDMQWILWALSGVMVLGSIWMALVSFYVHFGQDLQTSEIGVVHRLLGGAVVAFTWDQIDSATLRTRRNAITRDDRMLILGSRAHRMVFVTSVLRPADEEELLALVRSKITVIEQLDTPAV